MKTLSAWLLASAVGLVLALPSSAEAAKTSKYKKSSTATHAAKHNAAKHNRVVASARSGYWGTDAVARGPLYNGLDYLGDDPDPNVRAFILKDLSGHYGGSF